jgi:hypothetical protein
VVAASLPQSTARRGAHCPESAQLVQYSNGEIRALSLSVPGQVYDVTLEPLSCSCPSFRFRQHCYHSAAALARFARVEVETDPAPVSVRVCWSCGCSDPAITLTRRSNGRDYCVSYTDCQRRREAIRARYGY